MSATRAQINWASVTFGSTAITRITTGGFGQGGKLLRFKGDTDMYSTVIANVNNEPNATFHDRRRRHHHGHHARHDEHADGHTQRRQRGNRRRASSSR